MSKLYRLRIKRKSKRRRDSASKILYRYFFLGFIVLRYQWCRVARDYRLNISPLNSDAVCIRDTGYVQEVSLSLAPAFFRGGPGFPLPSPLFTLRGPLISSRPPPPVKRKRERAGGAPDASTMSARNIAGHHTGARFAMIPRVINNVCFNVNLRLGSNLISTEATRSNADSD